MVLPVPGAVAQKVKVGYDKSVEFARYATYMWAKPGSPPTRPAAYLTVVGSVDHELKSKGLSRTETGGDLILIPAGAVDFGFNAAAGTPILPVYGGPPPAIDATMWTGAAGPSTSMTTYVPEGTLILDFVDPTLNRIIWTGTVRVKLDVERKTKSLALIDKAVTKLLKQFPPQKK